MNRKDEIMKRGQYVYACFVRQDGFTYCNRKFADAASAALPAYILVEERFTTGHDDSAEFVELIDENENVIQSWMFEGPMKKCFEDPDLWDDDCLVYYLKETLKLDVVQNAWGRKVGEF